MPVPEQFDKAIEVWNLANEMDPASADVHTSQSPLPLPLTLNGQPGIDLASAYIMAPPSQPQLALQHLQ